MKYLVTYRLYHPEYLPSTCTNELEAHTHAELEERLARLLQKWRTDGYTVRILHVKPAHQRQARPIQPGKHSQRQDN